ncbi:hypothetical protein [Geomonas sp.]|uniref:hypothetical protein n=1 Tax=Geomonas sp. TaxID=2651584 RepID=UPI002B468B21|nr:hypothetical protein [Geomonas sp.]HJV35778.1 hypothetical protein [Geomonas sp.]
MVERMKLMAYTLVSPFLFGLFFRRYGAEKENAILYHPVFDDLQELVHHYYLAGHFLPQDATVIFQVTPALQEETRRIGSFPPPDYLGDCLTRGGQRFRFETEQQGLSLASLLRKHRPVSVLFWRAPKQSPLMNLALQSSLLHNVDRYSTWGCYSYPSFRHGLRTRGGLKQQRAVMQQKFLEYVDGLPNFPRAYLFGTGPSIEKAFDHDFSDGYRIVCNTMIKNDELMDHIKPHFMVAGDGIYHFGVSKYACRFRNDLERFLKRHRCLLVIPEGYYDDFVFHNEALAEFALPVPYVAQEINLRMKEKLEIKFSHNILNQLLLPLASSLCDEVMLLGFDGRKAGDLHFWKSSDSVNYEDLKVHQHQAHPGFFSGVDHAEYARIQSDCAEKIMSLGERMGKKYRCMNPSSNEALQKRFLTE